MKNLFLVLILSVFGMTAAHASEEEGKHLMKEAKIEVLAASETVVGKAKWINETTFRCKGRKNTCAIFGDDGGVHVFMVVFAGDSDIPSYQGYVEAYETIETEDEGEPAVEIHFIPYNGDE